MLFIHSSVSGHGFELWIIFWLLRISLNMSVQISVQESAFSFFGYILKYGLGGSFDNSVSHFFWGTAILFSTVATTFLSFEALYYKKLVRECVCSHSVVSDSLWPPWTVARQAPLSMGILQARILEWVAMPSSRGSSWPRDRTQVSSIAGGFFTIWATREAPKAGT